MSVIVKQQPLLTDLHSVINAVPRFPITVKHLVELARRKKAADATVAFYNRFPDDEIFEDKDDLVSRTESVEILRHQSAPREEMRAPEED
jgi:hypothetical protein